MVQCLVVLLNRLQLNWTLRVTATAIPTAAVQLLLLLLGRLSGVHLCVRLEAVRSCKGFRASRLFAGVGPLSGMRANVGLQVVRCGESLAAAIVVTLVLCGGNDND